MGYAISSPAIADVLNRVRQPFNVNSLAPVSYTHLDVYKRQGNGDEIRRRVEQGAIHVEKNCFQTHASHSLRSVWIM